LDATVCGKSYRSFETFYLPAHMAFHPIMRESSLSPLA